MHEQIHQSGKEKPDAAYQRKYGAVEQIDVLGDADGNHSHKGGDGRSDQYRDEYIGGLRGAHLCPVHHDADRNQYQPGSVQHQKHDHRVGGRVLLRVQFLQLLHRFQPHGSGGIVQPQHVGG